MVASAFFKKFSLIFSLFAGYSFEFMYKAFQQVVDQALFPINTMWSCGIEYMYVYLNND